MSPWRRAFLGDEIELRYGKSLASHERRGGAIAVFGSNGIVGSHDEFCVDGPGIVIGRKGSVGAVAFSAAPFWPIDTTYYVYQRRENDWRFLAYLLRSAGLAAMNSHSAVPGLNREDVYSIDVAMPERAEQQVIASVLGFVEQAAELEERVLRSATALKVATTRVLFGRGRRGESLRESEVGPIPDSWDVVSFSSVREFLQYGTSVRCTYGGGPYPVLRIPNIETGRIKAADLKYCNITPAEAARYELRDGDLLFIRTNGVIERLGTCAVYAGDPSKALFASYLIRARLKGGADPRFVAQYLGSRRGTSVIAERATPAADGKFNLNTSIIDSLPLPLPPTLGEQREIADILGTLDRKIDVHRRKHTLLEELFKSLLHQLMSGEIRVAELNLSALPQPVAS